MDTSAVGDPKGFVSGINLITIPATEKLVNLVVEKAKHMYQGAVHIGVLLLQEISLLVNLIN